MIFLIISCANQETTLEETQKTIEVIETVSEIEETSLVEIYNKLLLKNLPNTDTSSFDNFVETKAFSKKELQALQIEKLYTEYSDMKIYPSYKLNISERYKSIVVITFKGDSEMESALINYTLEGEYIESIIISYDEIAESMYSKESKIEGQFITIFEIVWEEEKQTTETKYHILPYYGEFSLVEFSGKSNLRLSEKIALNKKYIDTVKFLSYNDDGDYNLMVTEKNNEEIYFTFNWQQQEKYNFKYGDIIIVDWKMDSLFEAGEGGSLFFKEGAIDAVKLDISELKNDTVKFLWREDVYDNQLETTVNSIIVNYNFCSNISEQEKAAIAYVATFIGNECWWEFGTVNEDRSNLQCKILTALDLGFQCSDSHLGFLQKWFSNDVESLNALTKCGTTPYTATIQDTFDEIKVFNNGKTIAINYKVNAINLREEKSWSWSQVDYFVYDNESIKLVKSEKSEVLEKTLTIEEN